MEVSFTLDPQDITRYTADTQVNGVRVSLKRHWPLYALVVAGYAAIIWLGGRRAYEPVFWASTGGLAYYAYAVGYPMLRTRRRAAAGKLSAYHLGISPEWLHIRTEDCDGKMSWRTVEYVRETPTTVYLMCSIVSGMVIPKRAFSSGEEAAEFARLCEQYRQAAAPAAATASA